jgi:alkylhydroperoxidase family enzyme
VKLTEHAFKVTDEDIESLRSAGLSDDEILEGVFVACLFNAIDRLADTFGLYELMQLREH